MKTMWTDGPAFLAELTDPWAPHPVVNRHVCDGGGGGKSSSMPSAPDMSQYITAMSDIGNTLTGYGGDLYKWAQDQGIKLSDLATAVSNRAGQTADWATGGAQDMMANWKRLYAPIYEAQAARSKEFASNLPAIKEQWAGAYGAQTAQAIDASANAARRKLEGEGLSRPSIASGAIDLATRVQGAAAKTASANQGRMAAMQYSDQLTGQTEAAGTIFPQLSGQQAGIGLTAANQQVNAPLSTAATGASLYSPALSATTSGANVLKAGWGDPMQQSYDSQVRAYAAQQQAQNASSGGTGAILGSVLGAGATIAGSYFGGPLGGMAAGAATRGLMSAANSGQTYEEGGAVNTFTAAGNVVPPSASPSAGRVTDDVPVPIMDAGVKAGDGAINVGEFIWPKDVVAWRGESWMQKEIQKARKERATQSHAAPEKVPASQSPAHAFNPQPMGAAA